MAETEADGNGFLRRWSRRKLKARAGARPEEPETLIGDLSAQGQAPAGDAHEQRILTDADMPPLESLNAESDYSGFLSSGVSEDLRRKALSKLFQSPAFNLIDELDDYADDFTSFAVLGDVITADMRYRIEREAERLLDGDSESDGSSVAKDDDEAPREAEQVPGLAADARPLEPEEMRTETG